MREQKDMSSRSNFTNLFLSGLSQVGKTSLLLNVLGRYRDNLGGFITQRIIDVNEETVGFCISPIDQVSSPQTELKHAENVFLRKNSDGSWQTDLAVFEKAADMLDTKRKCAVFVLDEIGGVELASPVFLEKITELLYSKHLCVGVLKGEKNFDSLCRTIGEPMERDELFDLLQATNTKAIEVTTKNFRQIEVILINFLNGVDTEKKCAYE